MLKLDDVVIDSNGVLGIILDKCFGTDNDYLYGVLFTDVDEDNGLWWCTDNTEQIDQNYTIIKKVHPLSLNHIKFKKWYRKYLRLFNPR